MAVGAILDQTNCSDEPAMAPKPPENSAVGSVVMAFVDGTMMLMLTF
jgi:hypothetical protein